jgi:hypothetical protein
LKIKARPVSSSRFLDWTKRRLASRIGAAEPFDALNTLVQRSVLTRRRIWLAFAVAIVADGVQVLLGPLGWTFGDEVIDVMAMLLLTLLIGFHPLFLPTFLLEIIPVVDMLPTWTGCVALVVALRRKQQRTSSAPPPNIIDI